MTVQPLGNLVRIAPFDLSDLPPHPSIPQNPQIDSTSPSSDTRLLTFLRAILDEASSFLSPSTFTTTFTYLSTKSSSPSISPVEVYKREISSSEISSIKWSENQKIPRKTPAKYEDENWFARRSLHKNESSKIKEGNASWPEFVFGLKDQHSKHEQDFTPTLYDAHHVLDWNEEIKKLQEQGTASGEPWITGEHGDRYTDVTMEIFEMCHSLPGPLSPRCFPILVLTAHTTPTSFLAVTVPVNLLSTTPPLPAAYYSTNRNTTDASASSQQQKKPVLGIYAAVETVRMTTTTGEQDEASIEWTMATASDTKGNLPMVLQKPNLPGAVAKDVGFFMGWIKGVDGGV